MANFSDKTRDEMAALLHELRNNPKTSKAVARQIKELYPNARFSDLETDELKAYVDKKFEDDEIRREREEAQARWQAQRDAVAHRFTKPDGSVDEAHMGKIDAIIKKANYGVDYETAAKIYAAEMPAPRPQPEPWQQAQYWQRPNMKGFNENPQKWMRDKANETITELMAAKRSGSFN
ncbi:MAG: hypothetical protein KGL39_12420 [Patescibacteria group bacterium]|nr:hypothetical protein [Patescibacteria group bacterium]